MPNLIPKNHWSFRERYNKVDIHRILRDAEEVGTTLVRVRMQFRRGRHTYLFLRKESGDHDAIKHMRRRVSEVGDDMHPTEEGLECIVVDEPRANLHWTYIATNNEEDEKRILKLISDARDFRHKRQRITVECL